MIAVGTLQDQNLVPQGQDLGLQGSTTVAGSHEKPTTRSKGSRAWRESLVVWSVKCCQQPALWRRITNGLSIAGLGFGVESLELGIPVQEDQFGVAARPVCVLEAGIPRFGERFQRLCFLVQHAEAAGDIVENRGLGRAKGQG